MQSVIAVFDIGKSSKKFILLNRDYQVVHQDIVVDILATEQFALFLERRDPAVQGW